MRQARQTTGQFRQAAVREQLVDGGGFGHSSSGHHGHRAEQSAAVGPDGAQHLSRGLAEHGLRGTKEKA